jgi:hypothetical protein
VATVGEAVASADACALPTSLSVERILKFAAEMKLSIRKAIKPTPQTAMISANPD